MTNTNMSVFNFRMSDTDRKRLDERAAQLSQYPSKVTVSDIVRKLIHDYLNEEETS